MTFESRLYTFLDEAREFALYFLEGSRVMTVALRTGEGLAVQGSHATS